MTPTSLAVEATTSGEVLWELSVTTLLWKERGRWTAPVMGGKEVVVEVNCTGATPFTSAGPSHIACSEGSTVAGPKERHTDCSMLPALTCTHWW